MRSLSPPHLAWDDFYTRTHFACSTIPGQRKNGDYSQFRLIQVECIDQSLVFHVLDSTISWIYNDHQPAHKCWGKQVLSTR